jgi:hypothetical protein
VKQLCLLALMVGVGMRAPVKATEPAKIRAIAFDGLAILDPSPLWEEAERQFPGQGKELAL